MKTFKLTSTTLSSEKSSIVYFPIALLGIAQICSWGTLYYSFPQIAEAIIKELGWLKSEVYVALTVCLLFSSLAAIPVGRLIDQGKGRNVMTTGSVFAGISLIAGSQINSIIGLYIVFACIGILHAATLYEAAFSVIANNFDHDKTKDHIITLTLWGGFASTVFIPFIEYLLVKTDWRNTLIILGLINIFLCAVLYAFLPNNQPNHESHETKEIIVNNYNVKCTLQQPIFWALLVCFSLFAAGATTFKFHLYPILVEKGFTIQHAVIILAIMGPSQVLGRVLMKLVGSKTPALKLGIITTAILPITFFAMAFLPSNLWLLIPFVIAFSAATGTMTIVKGLAIPELLTKEAYGVINGAMNIPIKVIKSVSPTIAAFIWLITEDYELVLLVLVVVGILAVVCFSAVNFLSIYSQKR